MTDKDIIFVTAYKDINRKEWEYYNASNDYYINYFYNLANNIKYKLIVYLEDDIRSIITNNAQFNDNIIFKNLNEVDTFYNKYIENDRKIINSDIYRKKIPEWRSNSPEHLYSEYNLINHSKINFVRHTKELYSEYKFYAWIDFGRMNGDIDNIPKNLNISLIPENKITYHFVNNPPTSRENEDEMLTTHQVFILGSSFIVPTDLVMPFEKLFEDKLIEWQEKYITDDDQNLVLQIYFDNPELFNQLKHDKWYGMYSKLISDNKCLNDSYKIIVARYNEDISWLKDEMENCIIYNKGEHSLNIDNEFMLDNLGRESETYLNYIIKNYNNLPNVVIFTQASISEHRGSNDINYLINLKNEALQNDKSHPNIIHYQKEYKSSWGAWDKEWNVAGDLYYLSENYKNNLPISFYKWFIQNIDIKYPNPICIYSNGIFAVRKEIILNKPIEYYQKLILNLNHNINPTEGHFFERSWFYIFS